MDPSLAKTLKTTRGLAYRYYYSPAKDSKPTIFFAHGFPSTADSWHKQASFFQTHGYGVVVPDLLGYGGTDKPTDVDVYRLKLVVGDLMEIFDHEKLDKIVAIGHDWCVHPLSKFFKETQTMISIQGVHFSFKTRQLPSDRQSHHRVRIFRNLLLPSRRKLRY